jgi:hypothetical protein
MTFEDAATCYLSHHVIPGTPRFEPSCIELNLDVESILRRTRPLVACQCQMRPLLDAMSSTFWLSRLAVAGRNRSAVHTPAEQGRDRQHSGILCVLVSGVYADASNGHTGGPT